MDGLPGATKQRLLQENKILQTTDHALINPSQAELFPISFTIGEKKKIKTTSGKPGAPALKERLASKVSLYAEKRGLGSATEK